MPEDEARQREVDWSAFREIMQSDATSSPPPGQAPVRRSFVIGAMVCWAASFGLIGITWSGVADRTLVALQMPIVVSGGLATITLAIIGAALFQAGVGSR